MKIKKTHIENQPFVFQFQIPQVAKEKFSIELSRHVKLFCEGSIEKSSQDQFSLKGNYHSCLDTSCHFCLENFLYDASGNFQILLLPKNIFECQSIDSSSLDVDCYTGEEIVLGDYFETQFLLDIPFILKCQTDCKGVCVNCGVNLNKNSCICSQKEQYHPFAEYFQQKKK